MMGSVVLQVIENGVFACVSIPLTVAITKFDETITVTQKGLGFADVSNRLITDIDVLKGECTVSLPVNPFAENDLAHRMLLLQHIAKRTATFSPSLDLSNLAEIQRMALH